MRLTLNVINQVCADLGGTTTHNQSLSGINEICTLLGGMGGHVQTIDGLNEICEIQGKAHAFTQNLDALNALIAGTVYKTQYDAWDSIQKWANVNLSFTSAGAFSVAENTTAVGTIAATPAGCAFTIVAGDDGAKFSINASTGILTFVSAPDYEIPTDTGSNIVRDSNGYPVLDGNGDPITSGSDVADNIYYVLVRATKGSVHKDKYIIVTVTDVVEDLTPAVINDGNTVARYIADDLTTITKDGSNRVSAWNDKQATGHNLAQSGADGLKPIWSADGVLFDGFDDYMVTAGFTLNQPEHIYMVIKQVAWTSSGSFMDGIVQNSGKVYQRTSSPNIASYAGATPLENTNLAVGTWGIVRVLFNGASSKNIVNATTPVTGGNGTNNMGGIRLGCAGTPIQSYGHFQVKEVIVRKVADNSTDETAIYNYLKTKYSL